jgi:uncharacterized metal-binding protein
VPTITEVLRNNVEQEQNKIMETYALVIRVFLAATFTTFTYCLFQDLKEIKRHRKTTGQGRLRYVWCEFKSLFKEETQ